MADWSSIAQAASARAPKEKTPRIALVVGCAANVLSDIKAALSLFVPSAVYCVKTAGIYWPGYFEVFATLHPEAMDEYEIERHTKGYPNGYEIVAPLKGELGSHSEQGRIARRVSFRWPGMTSSASSGIYAAKVAIGDGYRVVLAGCPLDADAGHFLPGTWNVKKDQKRGSRWLERDSFTNGFEVATPFLKGKCKSMSGFTMKVLGSPSPGWLAESQS